MPDGKRNETNFREQSMKLKRAPHRERNHERMEHTSIENEASNG
jgi:hypothetical protein